MSNKVSQQEAQERANKLSQLLNRSKMVMEKSETIDTKNLSIEGDVIQPSRINENINTKRFKEPSDDYVSIYDQIEESSPEPFINPNQHGLQNEYDYQRQNHHPQYIHEQPNGNIKEEIKKKLPKEILDLMEKTPVHLDPSVVTGNVGVPTHLLNKSRDLQNRLDEKYETKNINLGNIKKGNIQKPQITDRPKGNLITENKNFNIDINELKSMIKEIVYETINEVYEEKLIKEDINIKIGNTIFSGSLKPIKKIK
jgi:hypothetical protein